MGRRRPDQHAHTVVIEFGQFVLGQDQGQPLESGELDLEYSCLFFSVCKLI